MAPRLDIRGKVLTPEGVPNWSRLGYWPKDGMPSPGGQRRRRRPGGRRKMEDVAKARERQPSYWYCRSDAI